MVHAYECKGSRMAHALVVTVGGKRHKGDRESGKREPIGCTGGKEMG